MRTIEPLHLEALYENGQAIELIDLRPRAEFDRLHPLGARSIPLADLHQSDLFDQQRLASGTPLYLICRKKALAKQAAKELAAAGRRNALVVEGGVEAWEHCGLPLVRQDRARNAKRLFAAALLALAAVVALLGREFFIASALWLALVIVGLDWRESSRRHLPELAPPTAT